MFPARRPFVLSRPATALAVAKIGDTAVLVADRAAVLGVSADGTLRFGADAPRIFVHGGVVVGLAGQVGYETDAGTVDLREEVPASLSSRDPVTPVRRLLEAHAAGILTDPGVPHPAVGRACPAATIAVIAREFDGDAAIDVAGLADDGGARTESLTPFGGGAFAPRGPLLDALQYELAHTSATTPRQLVESLAHAIGATVPHVTSNVTATLDVAVIAPGQPPRCFAARVRPGRGALTGGGVGDEKTPRP